MQLACISVGVSSLTIGACNATNARSTQIGSSFSGRSLALVRDVETVNDHLETI